MVNIITIDCIAGFCYICTYFVFCRILPDRNLIPPFTYRFKASVVIVSFIGFTMYVCYDSFVSSDTAQFLAYTRKLPSAIVVGVRQCETKILMFYLKTHPHVLVIERDLQFFSNEYRKGDRFYFNHLPVATDGAKKIVIERSLTYWAHTHAGVPKRIQAVYKKYNKNVKIIILMCDPTKRVILGYRWGKQNGLIKASSIADYVEDNDQGINRSRQIIREGLYDLKLPQWFHTFHEDNVFIMDEGDLLRNPNDSFRHLETFLKIPHTSLDNYFFNQSDGKLCKLHSITGITCMTDESSRVLAEYPPQLIDKLRLFYTLHNQNLSVLTNRKFSWNY